MAKKLLQNHRTSLPIGACPGQCASAPAFIWAQTVFTGKKLHLCIGPVPWWEKSALWASWHGCGFVLNQSWWNFLASFRTIQNIYWCGCYKLVSVAPLSSDWTSPHGGLNGLSLSLLLVFLFSSYFTRKSHSHSNHLQNVDFKMACGWYILENVYSMQVCWEWGI